MSRWLDLARKSECESNSVTDTLQKPAIRSTGHPEDGFLQVPTGCREEDSDKPLIGASLKKTKSEHTQNPEITLGTECAGFSSMQEKNEGAAPYGTSPGGRPLTHTGKVVSLAAWKELGDWEKHGPKGKLWSGLIHAWDPFE